MNHNRAVHDDRPKTDVFDPEDRLILGLAVTRAREAMELSQRALASLAKISRTPLWKLENGQPVTAQIYEAVARAIPWWTEDTPVAILRDKAVPPPPPADTPSREPERSEDDSLLPSPERFTDEWVDRFRDLLSNEEDVLQIRLLVFALRKCQRRVDELERIVAERDVPQS